MERHFHEELMELKKKIVEMADLVRGMTELSVGALEARRIDEGDPVHAIEARVNHLEVEVEKEVLRLLALRQPAAGDLRFLIATLKLAHDLERIADQACNLSETTGYLLQRPPLGPFREISEMASLAQKMIFDAMEAFVTHDAALARDVMRRDDAVDALKGRTFTELLARMSREPESILCAVDLILVSRNLERIADHATNIAEEVVFIEEGKNEKHHFEAV